MSSLWGTLYGEGRAARRDENIFAIQTPVAIAIALKDKITHTDTLAKVHYTLIEGTREDKLSKLNAINNFSQINWQECPNEWQAPFIPAGEGLYFSWPLLTDLTPWQHSGVQLKRTWPISFDRETLKRRWHELMNTDDRGKAFKESSDRKVSKTYRVNMKKKTTSHH